MLAVGGAICLLRLPGQRRRARSFLDDLGGRLKASPDPVRRRLGAELAVSRLCWLDLYGFGQGGGAALLAWAGGDRSEEGERWAERMASLVLPPRFGADHPLWLEYKSNPRLRALARTWESLRGDGSVPAHERLAFGQALRVLGEWSDEGMRSDEDRERFEQALAAAESYAAGLDARHRVPDRAAQVRLAVSE